MISFKGAHCFNQALPLSVLVYCSLWYWTIGHGIMAYSVLMPYGRW